jgi:hypothetical protein
MTKWVSAVVGISLWGGGAALADVSARSSRNTRSDAVASAPVENRPSNEASEGEPVKQFDSKRSTQTRKGHVKAVSLRQKSTARHRPPPRLSSSQRTLATIYNDEGDRAKPGELPTGNRSSAAVDAPVSQAAIASVVTQNRRALNLCYDRVLKHDETLKRAHVAVHVKIGLSGRVRSVSIPGSDDAHTEIAQCLSQSIKRWNFPASNSEYEAELPLILQAD